MADDKQVIAQAADGTQHVFPAGTDPAVIDGAMKRYVQAQQPGAFQQRPGAPILNAKQLGIQGQSPSDVRAAGPQSGGAAATAEQVASEAGLGAISGLSGAPETQTPVRDLGKSMVAQGQEFQAQPMWKQALQMMFSPQLSAIGIGKNIYGAGKEAVNSIGSPMLPGSTDIRGVAHGIGSLFGQAGNLGLLEKGGEAVTDPFPGIKQGAQEIMNEGPTTVKVLGNQHAHAIATQKHIAGVADAVHADAQQAMAQVSATVDAAKPGGVFDKTDVGNRVEAAVKDIVSDNSQLPKAIRDLLPKEPTGGKSTGPTVGGRHFDLSNPSDLKAYQKMKAQGAFTPQEIQRMEGGGNGDMHSFNDLQQARSNIGRQMQSLEGSPKAAANAAYGELSKVLREGAREVGAEPDWIDANARYKNYMDDFVRSPLAKTLAGENAHDIMDPLVGKSRMQVLDILSKYEPFGMDLKKFNEEVGGFNLGSKTLKLGEPTKRTALLAAISPKIAAASVGIPRMLRNPSVTRAVMGEGFEAPTIKPNKVYPTKEAAAAALKDRTPPESSGESEMERLRRNPPAPTKEMSESEKAKADVKKKQRGGGRD